jgi:hypothetical protein
MVGLTISDGEIDAFKILRVTEVAKIIRSSTGSYKANSALVVIDFLYRHGFTPKLSLSLEHTSCRHLLTNEGPTLIFSFFSSLTVC